MIGFNDKTVTRLSVILSLQGVGVTKDCSRTTPRLVYLHQNKKKVEDKGKNCHDKTMWSLEKPIYLT
jgi:hypothetical protein